MLRHLQRWWIYQRERFPLLAHGPLVAAFSFSAVAYSSLLRGITELPSLSTWLVAFFTALAFFMQLRIADEFKDYEEDCSYRPYRPVPRGLVTLRELGIVGILLAILQLTLALWLFPPLLIFLGLTWSYLALMSREFFVSEWLKARPVTYMWSHMLIMPLIDLYASACDWLVAGDGHAVRGLVWFLAVSFFNGMVIEIGRKIRAPEDEEPGVETYSVLWGCRKAVRIWLAVLLVTAICAAIAAWQIDFLIPVAVVLVVLFGVALVVAKQFLAHPLTGAGKRFEVVAGVWTLGMYLSLGAGPLLWSM
ncbi:UbiA family prenyltransferase [Gynuella sunshinyii]|uniref:4-hydroxybenzoate polyprenyltransferase and related prenyltransferase n=1 Tax=Gynuella sunshinyii YC6258 TaxID=1445510 RepID=A0A0C5VR67_9GAMM|nr:UbiA family prenyltransferase [Gynuella sunshinyii]AJQ97132.1 4-hydroxybenzoate polyprenyltransferase and related prenyltransferase [Gynuella sunshinyii YC6258]